MVRQRSDHISFREAQRFWDAVVFSICKGRPFNILLTVHITQGRAERPRQFLTAFRKAVGEWIRRKSFEAVHECWVLENPPATEKGGGGLNVHIILHVPPNLVSAFMQQNRLDNWGRQAGLYVYDGVIEVTKLKCSTNLFSEDFLRHGVLGLCRYLLKGIEPAVAYRFGIRPEYQGIIWGKRLGYSESLGQQRRWGLVPTSHADLCLAGPDRRYRVLLQHICPELLDPEQTVSTAGAHGPCGAR